MAEHGRRPVRPRRRRRLRLGRPAGRRPDDVAFGWAAVRVAGFAASPPQVGRRTWPLPLHRPGRCRDAVFAAGRATTWPRAAPASSATAAAAVTNRPIVSPRRVHRLCSWSGSPAPFGLGAVCAPSAGLPSHLRLRRRRLPFSSRVSAGLPPPPCECSPAPMTRAISCPSHAASSAAARCEVRSSERRRATTSGWPSGMTASPSEASSSSHQRHQGQRQVSIATHIAPMPWRRRRQRRPGRSGIAMPPAAPGVRPGEIRPPRSRSAHAVGEPFHSEQAQAVRPRNSWRRR